MSILSDARLYTNVIRGNASKPCCDMRRDRQKPPRTGTRDVANLQALVTIYSDKTPGVQASSIPPVYVRSWRMVLPWALEYIHFARETPRLMARAPRSTNKGEHTVNGCMCTTNCWSVLRLRARQFATHRITRFRVNRTFRSLRPDVYRTTTAVPDDEENPHTTTTLFFNVVNRIVREHGRAPFVVI